MIKKSSSYTYAESSSIILCTVYLLFLLRLFLCLYDERSKTFFSLHATKHERFDLYLVCIRIKMAADISVAWLRE